MNLKGYGRKRLLRNLMHYPGNCLEGTDENLKDLGQDTSPDRGLNPVRIEYEVEEQIA